MTFESFLPVGDPPLLDITKVQSADANNKLVGAVRGYFISREADDNELYIHIVMIMYYCYYNMGNELAMEYVGPSGMLFDCKSG